MIKRIFILCTLLLATAYLILAVTTFNSKPANQVCKGMELTVKDSIDYGFVTDKEVKEILKKGKIYYVRIRAYKMDSTGKKVYGKYSSMKKVKVSK